MFRYNYSVFLIIHSIAMACWSFHYIKRLLETVLVHRFSHNTMPIRNLFKVCGSDLYQLFIPKYTKEIVIAFIIQ